MALSGFGRESGFVHQAWDRARAASLRWAVAGALVGLAVGVVAFAPARWLAQAVAAASGEHVLLADARGSVWAGSAVAVLAGGPGSRDAAALPGRIAWSLGLSGAGIEARLTQACCLNGSVALRLSPGFGRWTAALVSPGAWVGQWPTAWLGGLGAPWNTLQLGGTLRLLSPGVNLEWVAGRWRVDGSAELEFMNTSSRLSTLDSLGDYRLQLAGDAANAGQPQIALSTQSGALQLSGSGTLGPAGMRFRGEARADAGAEQALANLLNIIGRRDGARSLISVG
ncbi:MAG: type II secretion system protein N [Ideonella sp.]|nr:type II secretion system protein N [Ideonella sp.]